MDAQALTWTTPYQLTETIRRDIYDAIRPTKDAAAGKIIVISGAGTGIGSAIATVWANAGAEGVVLAARRVDKLEETAASVRQLSGGKTRTLVVQTDVADDAGVAVLFARTIETFRRSPDVVVANAGVLGPGLTGEQSPNDWWQTMEINIKGVYAMAHHFIHTQIDSKVPKGTFISINSSLAGFIQPGMSAYSISKLATQRLVEYLDAGIIPDLRSFSTFPGIVLTPIIPDGFKPYAHDAADLTGMLCLYLASPRAYYLEGGLTSINWDITEQEAQKDRIVKEQLLKLKWQPILPASGGEGLKNRA